MYTHLIEQRDTERVSVQRLQRGEKRLEGRTARMHGTIRVMRNVSFAGARGEGGVFVLFLAPYE